jgi:hypothetical protein
MLVEIILEMSFLDLVVEETVVGEVIQTYLTSLTRLNLLLLVGRLCCPEVM